MWGWLITLAIISFLSLLYTIFILLSPSMALKRWGRKLSESEQTTLKKEMTTVQFGGTHIVHQLERNMDRRIFEQFIKYLVTEFEKDE